MMPRMRHALVAMLLVSGAVALPAESVSAGSREIRLGPIEVGVTPCSEAERAIVDSGSGEGGYFAKVTGAVAYKLFRGAFGFDFVQDGFVACDEGGRAVAAVVITIPKHRVGEIANSLSRSHRQLSRNLPSLGDGRARFRSASGETVAEITYVHVSFSADLVMQTRAYESAFEAWRRRQADDERQRLEGAF